MIFKFYPWTFDIDVEATKQLYSENDYSTDQQLSALGLDTAEIITDNGYYSEQNLAEMLYAGYHFLTLVKTNIKWVKKEIDGHMDEFTSIGSVCPFDPGIYGITVKLI